MRVATFVTDVRKSSCFPALWVVRKRISDGTGYCLPHGSPTHFYRYRHFTHKCVDLIRYKSSLWDPYGSGNVVLLYTSKNILKHKCSKTAIQVSKWVTNTATVSWNKVAAQPIANWTQTTVPMKTSPRRTRSNFEHLRLKVVTPQTDYWHMS